MDVLCVDKTGTLTRNELAVTDVRPMAGFDKAQVLGLAALASSDGGQDPVDAAIRGAAAASPARGFPKLMRFVPFDPALKMSEALVQTAGGLQWKVAKGACAVILGQAVLFGNVRVFEYALIAWLVAHLFVVTYEEPTLRKTFGAEYESFCANVPRWILRLAPWRGGTR